MPINFGSSGIGEIYYGSTPIKEVYSGGTLVWSAVKPSYGLVFGPQNGGYSWWNGVPTGQWAPMSAANGTAGLAHPHPGYPDTAITSNGVNVSAGTYTATVWSTVSGNTSGQRGIRATLNGSPIPGLSKLQNYSNQSGALIDVSGVVEIGAGNITLEGWIASSSAYLSTGKPSGGSPSTGFTLIPYVPGSWPQTGTWSGNSTSTATTYATFTVPEAGVYNIEWSITWGGTGTLYGQASYRTNGGTPVNGNLVTNAPGTSTVTRSEIALAVGDVIEFRAGSVSGTRAATGAWSVNKVG